MSIIVAGGYFYNNSVIGLVTVEILDEEAKSWRSGPSMPAPKWAGALVEDQRGGVVFAGGYQALNVATTNIYRLKHAGPSARWEVLAQKLRQNNFGFVGLLIPDRLTNCTYP